MTNQHPKSPIAVKAEPFSPGSSHLSLYPSSSRTALWFPFAKKDGDEKKINVEEVVVSFILMIKKSLTCKTIFKADSEDKVVDEEVVIFFICNNGFV